MTDRLEAIASTVKERPIVKLEDEISRLRDQRDDLVKVCKMALDVFTRPQITRTSLQESIVLENLRDVVDSVKGRP